MLQLFARRMGVVADCKNQAVNGLESGRRFRDGVLMSSIQVRCRQCRQRFKAKAQLAGKRVKCPSCGSPIEIPDPRAVSAAEAGFGDGQGGLLAGTEDRGMQGDDLLSGAPARSGKGVGNAGPGSGQPLMQESDPLGIGALESSGQARPLRPSFQKARGRDKGPWPGKLVAFWPSAVVAAFGVLASLVSVLTGHPIAAGVLLVIGLAIAGCGLVFPGGNRKSKKTKGNAGSQIAATCGTGLLLIGAFVIRVLVRMSVRGQLGERWVATAFGAVVGVGLIIGPIIGFIYCVARFGFFRPTAVFYSLVTVGLMTLFVGAHVPSRDLDLPGAEQLASEPLPSFPDLGPAREIAPGVDFREVRLPVPTGQPGSASKLFVYTPEGDHAPRSLPCVFIASAGAVPFTGMELGAADQPEHIPYAEAGFVVVAYEIDGYLPNPDGASDRQYMKAIEQFTAARVGLTNARNAIEFALARIPEVDPEKLFSAGHSSGGQQSLLLAANEPRLKACIAYAPVSDVERSVKEMLPILRRRINNLDALLDLASPRANESRIQCPVFLFHAHDDSVVSYSQSMAFADRLRDAGKPVTLAEVHSGGHYDPMISHGIPRAIAWLGQFSGEVGNAGELSTGPGSDPSSDAAGYGPQDPAAGSLDDGALELEYGGEEELRAKFEQWKAEAGVSNPPQVAKQASDNTFAVTNPSTGDNADNTQSGAFLSRLSTSNPLEQREVIQELARTDPESVSESEREAIVQTLNQLAEGNTPFSREEALRALAAWGDAGSVDVLLRLLGDRGTQVVRKEVYRTLGELKDPRAALPVARKLGDVFDKNEARECLRAMGAVAEEALITVAPSNDPEISLAAVTLLGECGTEECISVLRQAYKSRNPAIRQAAKAALRAVRLRQSPES
ncbi:MAG: HEAT repeat domain-containing protein [Planctomycetota bacterium]